MNILGFIPARGGSKSVPLKNMHPLGGKPLIQWCLEAATKCLCLDQIIVSTDNRDIAEFSESMEIGVDWRPDHLQADTTLIHDVVIDYIYRHEGIGYDVVCLIQPTNPFVKQQSIEFLCQAQGYFNSAHTVCSVPHHYHRTVQRYEEGGNLAGVPCPSRKQNRRPTFAYGGCLSVEADAIDTAAGLFPGPIMWKQVSRIEAFDVDTEEDFIIAEAFITAGLV